MEMATNVEPSHGGGPAAKAVEGAEQLKEKALQRMDEAREKASSGKDRLSDRIWRVSSAIRSAGQNLGQEDESVARLADRASERFERAAEYVRLANPKQVMRDVAGFARREPAMFYGGAFLLGLAAARFLKSSQREAWESGRTEQWEEPLEVPISE
jgi:hypothetical protein